MSGIKHLGLTGGIGSGKSTVARLLVQQGAVLIDADAISRQLMAPGSPVLQQVADAFGTGVLTDDGALDRPALAQLVFGDEQARARLNGIVHPAVREEAARQYEAARAHGAQVVVEDIPLLAETGQASRFDGVLVVETEEPVRIQRLVQARGMAEEDARARIRAQATDAQRRAIATWTVENSGTEAQTRAQVERLWGEITGA